MHIYRIEKELLAQCYLLFNPAMFESVLSITPSAFHLQDVGDDDDDSAFTDNLNRLLREFRAKKQAKEISLLHRAIQDGRPFSAPAASPDCDSIRRRMVQDDMIHRGQPKGMLTQALAMFGVVSDLVV